MKTTLFVIVLYSDCLSNCIEFIMIIENVIDSINERKQDFKKIRLYIINKISVLSIF